MKLTKFFRKHGRTLLMVFMALLLVAFLIPDAIQGLDPGDRIRGVKLGEAFGRTLYSEEIRALGTELRVVQQLGMAVGAPPTNVLGLNVDALDHYLLTEEAARAGIRIGRDEVKERLRAAGVTNEDLRRVAQDAAMSYDRVYDTLGRWIAVWRLMFVQAAALTVSLPRAELAYRNEKQEAVATVSVLHAKAFLGRVPEPTEEELTRFFEEGKNRTTAHTEDTLVYGYRLPDRVQLEYLTVEPEPLRSYVTARTTALEQFFEEHRARYTKPDPAATEPGATVPMTFDEARDKVREDYRTQRAAEVAQAIVNEMRDEALAPWRAQERGADGFYPPPEEIVSFEALRDKYQKRYEIQYGAGLRISYHKTDLVDAPRLALIPGLGQASVADGTRNGTPMRTAAFRVKGISDPQTTPQAVNLLEPGPVAISRIPGRLHQAYLYRVVAVAPAAPPAALEDVRPKVVEDWKNMRAFELARVEAEKLREAARAVGLAAAIEQATELKAYLAEVQAASTQPSDGVVPPAAPNYLADLGPRTADGIRRNSPMIRGGVGTSAALVKALFEFADRPPAGQRPVALAPQPSALRWALAELERVKPLYQESLASELPELIQRAVGGARSQFVQVWFGNVRTRTGFVNALPTAGP